MLARSLAVAMFASVFAFGNCVIEEPLLEAINAIEGHPSKEPRYPYIISFNRKQDSRLAKDAGLQGWLDNRTIDCGDQQTCAELTGILVDAGIRNLDLGAYQINYIYHKYSFDEYFDNTKAEVRVCEILFDLYKKRGWSWEVLGRYHSSVPKRNEFYRTKLADKYAEVIRGYEN
jgi:hypothetical protein